MAGRLAVVYLILSTCRFIRIGGIPERKSQLLVSGARVQVCSAVCRLVCSMVGGGRSVGSVPVDSACQKLWRVGACARLRGRMGAARLVQHPGAGAAHSAIVIAGILVRRDASSWFDAMNPRACMHACALSAAAAAARFMFWRPTTMLPSSSCTGVQRCLKSHCEAAVHPGIQASC